MFPRLVMTDYYLYCRCRWCTAVAINIMRLPITFYVYYTMEFNGIYIYILYIERANLGVSRFSSLVLILHCSVFIHFLMLDVLDSNNIVNRGVRSTFRY